MPCECSNMADETEKSALERIAEVLVAHGVEFIVIGGRPEVLRGTILCELEPMTRVWGPSKC